MNHTTQASNLPFLMRLSAGRVIDDENVSHGDTTTLDPLPLELRTDAVGLVFNRATRLTEVNRETTDDR